jgi:DNA-binding transcriptional MerR regulator
MARIPTQPLQISEVARRSGFSSATLRYYEDIGLLPAPDRTAAGYRSYSERDLARLGFISRAKQLGCSLEEIRDLVDLWDGDRCGPVQHELRSLVGRKLTGAQGRIDELLALTAELRSTAARLAREPDDGACSSECACLGSDDVLAETSPAGVPAGADVDGPIACSLDASAMGRRFAEWQSVMTAVDRREHLDGGVRLVFDHRVALDEVARLATAEHECCPFFSFAITVDGRGAALEVTAPPAGRDAVRAAFGPPD